LKVGHTIIRLNRYIRTYGIFKTIQHLFEYLKLAVIQNKYIIFFSELTEVKDEFDTLPETVTIESKKSKDELSLAEIDRLSSYWIDEIIKNNIEERYNRGNTTIWLLKDRGEIAAFIWTTTKILERDRFFPYSQRDVYLFDAGTFPEYRGRHYQSLLATHIHKKLKRARFIRCFIYVHELNEAMLRSISRSGWQKLGTARKFHICGHDIVIWSNMAGEN
jgi:ribosomal protein S18 acetylase RimI-like enzyme